MKNLTFLFLFLITININAQEKQNDATWEETIDFIDKYKNKLHFDKYLNSIGRSIASREKYAQRTHNKVTKFKNQIRNRKYLNVNTFYDNGRQAGGMDFVLPYLIKVELDNKSLILHSSNGSKIYFNIYDAYYKERLHKAFIQLAYLAIEKKKKEIEKEKEKSGEKFK